MPQQIDVPGMGVVEFPDGMDDAAITAAIQKNLPKQGPSSSVGGVAKSLGTGLAEGAIGLAGLPGDLYHMGLRALGDKLTPESGYGSGAIKKGVEGVTGEFYKPQGAIEETVNKVGQFAPAMIGGPEALAAKFATRVAAPAVASEIGGQVAGPYGEVAGALLGAAGGTVGARKFQAMGAARNAASAVPSGEDLLKAGSNGFEAVKASDAVIKPSSVQQMAKDIKTELLNDGKHPSIDGQAGLFSALDRLEAMGASAGGVTPKDMEVIRKNLVGMKTALDPSAAGAARQATNSFMEKYANMGPQDLLHGKNPFPTLKDAVADWAAGKRSATVTGKVDLANLNAGTAGSGANIDNNTRQAIKQLARPMNNTNVPVARKLGFNDQEIDAIKRAATGTGVGNTARYLGKLAPTGSVSGVLSGGAGFAAAGPVGAIGLPAAGYLAKKIGDLSTKRAVQAIDSLVRSRSPLAAQVAASLPPAVVQQLPAKSQSLLQSLILADPVLSKQASQPVGQPRTQ